MKRFLPVVCLVALVGCNRIPEYTPQESDFGPEPSQVEVDRAVTTAVQEMALREPASAQVTGTRLVGKVVYDERIPSRRWVGWRIVFYLNAKNGYGGFTGPVPYILIVQKDGTYVCRTASSFQYQ